jgi:hypothetical protein
LRVTPIYRHDNAWHLAKQDVQPVEEFFRDIRRGFFIDLFGNRSRLSFAVVHPVSRPISLDKSRGIV